MDESEAPQADDTKPEPGPSRAERPSIAVTPEFLEAANGLAEVIEEILPNQNRATREMLSRALLDYYKSR